MENSVKFPHALKLNLELPYDLTVLFHIYKGNKITFLKR